MNQIAEIQITYSTKVPASQRPKVLSSKDAFQILFKSWDANTIEYREEFKILLLNRSNKVLGIYNVSAGGVAGTVVDPKIIFGAAIKANASSIILSHNHPSGNLSPSDADIKITKKLKEAGTFLEIPVLDHVIITTDNYYSFADNGNI